MKAKRMAFLLVVLTVGLLAAAYSVGTDGQEKEVSAADQAAVQQTDDTAVTREVSVSYDPIKAHTEAYWYSRFNLGNLVMRSGMGVQLKPPMEKVKQMMEMAGITEGPSNPYLVQALYRSGDPLLIQEFNGDATDFSNFRWDQSEMDKAIVPQAMAYTIIKEVIWAKSFASDVEGPDPMNHFRALVLSAEAAAQAQYLIDNLRSQDGLFVGQWEQGAVVDSTTAPQDQMVILWALSELADYVGGKYGWYAAPLTQDQASMWADELVYAVQERANAQPGFLTGMPSRDLGVALSALSSYAGYSNDGASKTLVVETLIPRLAQELTDRMDSQGRLEANGGYSEVATQATAIHGMVFASKVRGDASYRRDTMKLWEYMETLWDESANLYAPSPGDKDYTYTTRDVGDVIGAFNGLLNGLGVDIDQRFADFFQSAVNESGLQIAEERATGGSTDNDSIPAPADAGGLYGRAPVLATEVVYHTASGA